MTCRRRKKTAEEIVGSDQLREIRIGRRKMSANDHNIQKLSQSRCHVPSEIHLY